MIDADKVKIENDILRIPIFATDFGRYQFAVSGKWRIIFPYISKDNSIELIPETELSKKYPKAYDYLQLNKNVLKKRKQYREWYGYSAPRNLNLHEKANILVPLLADRASFAMLPTGSEGKYCLMASGGFSISLLSQCLYNPKYILGLLNSCLMFWQLKNLSNIFRGGWITCTKQYFGELPIRTINFDDAADKARHDHIVSLVEQMLAAKARHAAATTESEKNRLDIQIEALDRQIDNAVYELYGLTEDEIKIVEGE